MIINGIQDVMVIDCEIQESVTHNSQWERTDLMKVSVICMYEYKCDRYRVYGPKDLDHVRNKLLMSGLVVGHNINRFDLPVIFGITQSRKNELSHIKTFDTLEVIWESLGLDITNNDFTNMHKGWSLDSCCKGSLNISKSGSGAFAPQWYQEGNIWRVIDYCQHDVKMVKELFEFIVQKGFVRNSKNCVVPIKRSPMFAYANDLYLRGELV
jgi:DEAD/DEAH box helicase domain-containing protein